MNAHFSDDHRFIRAHLDPRIGIQLAATCVTDGRHLFQRLPPRAPLLRWSAPEVVMATCKSCGEEVDQLVTVKVDGKSKKLCEDCADRAREAAEVAEASESVVQDMMGFKGRR